MKSLKRSLLLAIASLLTVCASAQAENPDHVRQLLRTNNCPGCDLSEADLRELDLSGANLSNANLSNAKLNQSNLTRSNLSQATLQGADLSGVNFNGANLSQASLENAKLLNFCQIERSFARNASDCLSFSLFRTLGPTELCAPRYELNQVAEVKEICDELSSSSLALQSFTPALYGFPGLPSVSMRGTNLTAANLRGVNFTGVDFRFATLNQAQLQEADLSYAMLLDAEMMNVQGAELQEAFVKVTDIRSALVSALAQEKEAKRKKEAERKEESQAE